MGAIFGETLVFDQENGPRLELVVWGDEFYVRYETRDGYSVCHDPETGYFCYAELRNGHLVSTGAAATKQPPLGLRRHLQESMEVQQAKFEARHAKLNPQNNFSGSSDRLLTIGPSKGLLRGRRVSRGNVTGLTILVEFNDIHSTVDPEDVDAMLNAVNYQKYGNCCSVREYFQTMSNGKLDYNNIVVGPVRLSRNRKYYEKVSIVPEAFEMAMEALNADDINVARFDSRDEGTIDAMSFMYAGETVYGINGDDDNPSELWPHNSICRLQHNGYRTYFYQLSSMGRRAVDLSIGTFCHETGHLLCRFPDLYDYGRRDGDYIRSRGLGRYCLMGGGNHLNYGRTPSPICSYLRELTGWTDNVILLNGPGEYSARHGDYGTILKYQTAVENEYFLVENRSKNGLDKHLPSAGLAVYHCDIYGSNEWQAGTADRHYQCALLQADGRQDLEANLPSDSTDLFRGVDGIAVAHNTRTSSRMWDGSDSGLIISDIGEPDDVIRFNIGPGTVLPTSTLQEECIAHLLIPDNDPEGISSSIIIEENGKIENISVSIDITHTYIGDLAVSLKSPGGEQVILHDREGGYQDDIQTTCTPENSRLYVLENEEIAGTWNLMVRDLQGRDTGRLNRWGMEIKYKSSEESIQGEAQPDLEIPDATMEGISSTIPIDADGLLKRISVYVEIDHTFIGDLHVELLSPSGQSAILHNQEGGSRDNLKLNFDSTSAPALNILTGQPIQGDWTLRVRDLQQIDKGRLISWHIDIRYTP